MGKMTMALLLVFAIELSLSLFMSSTPTGGQTALYTLLINPGSADTSGFWLLFIGRMGALTTLSGIVAGFLFLVRVEPAYAMISGTLITFGLNLARLWVAISSQGVFGDSGNIIATICVSPLLIFYVMACMDYIRSPNG
jgi:hypothetical protein